MSSTPVTPQDPKSRAEGEPVPWREKIGLGLGNIVAAGSYNSIHVLVSPVYNVTLGLSPALISLVVFIQRLWDAMLDPLFGQFSDNFRSRFGRRRPLLAVAILPLTVFFVAIWFVPAGWTSSAMFLYLLFASLLFFAAHSLYAMPLAGLTVEATDDTYQRTRIAGFVQICAVVFAIGANWLFHFAQLPWFGDTLSGVRWVTTSVGVGFLLCGCISVWVARERLYAKVASRQPRVSFRESLRPIRHNPAFVVLLGVRFVVNFGHFLVSALGFYMNFYFVHRGDLKAAAMMGGWLGTTFQISAIIAIVVFRRLAPRVGKRVIVQLSLLILLAGSLAKLVVFQPAHPYWQLVIYVANGAGLAGISLMSLSMLGDIVDYDEWKHGVRHEALYASVSSWFEKAGNSFGALLSGFLLVWIGFDVKLGGAQSETTLRWMHWLFTACPFFGALVALLIIRRYSLDEAQVRSIKEELTKRRAADLAPLPHGDPA